MGIPEAMRKQSPRIPTLLYCDRGGSGADGAVMVRLRRTGVFEFDAAALTQAMVGDTMYAADDQTFADTTGVTNHIEVGTLAKYVSTTKGWIDIAR